MSMKLCSYILALGIVAIGSNISQAVPVTWTLVDVGFDDGGIAEGTFEFDADTNSIEAWSISVSGGNNTSVFVPITYSDTILGHYSESSFGGSGQALNFRIPAPTTFNRERHLRLFATEPLTNLGGDIPLGKLSVANSFNLECFNCGPVREITLDALITAPKVSIVSEPVTAAMFSFALLGLVAIRGFSNSGRTDKSRTPFHS